MSVDWYPGRSFEDLATLRGEVNILMSKLAPGSEKISLDDALALIDESVIAKRLAEPTPIERGREKRKGNWEGCDL